MTSEKGRSRRKFLYFLGAAGLGVTGAAMIGSRALFPEPNHLSSETSQSLSKTGQSSSQVTQSFSKVSQSSSQASQNDLGYIGWRSPVIQEGSTDYERITIPGYYQNTVGRIVDGQTVWNYAHFKQQDNYNSDSYILVRFETDGLPELKVTCRKAPLYLQARISNSQKYDFLSYRVDVISGVIVTSAVLKPIVTLHPSNGGPDIVDIDASFVDPFSRTYDERWKSNYIVLGDSFILEKGEDITLATQKNAEFVLAIAMGQVDFSVQSEAAVKAVAKDTGYETLSTQEISYKLSNIHLHN